MQRSSPRISEIPIMPRAKLELPASFPYTTEIPLRISDINYGGHLGNDAVLSILHEARVRFLRQYGYSELDIDGAAIMMTDAVILYRSEGFYGDVLTIDVGVTDVQSAACDVVYRLTNRSTGAEVVRAKTGIVFIDPQRKAITAVPEKFRQTFPGVSERSS
jgi:acyl-CoA thioester hydrolase